MVFLFLYGQAQEKCCNKFVFLLRNYLWADKEQEAKCRVKVEVLLCEEKK